MAILLKYREVVTPGSFGALLVHLSKRLRGLDTLLHDGGQTQFVLVTRAAELPRQETVRLRSALADLGIAVGAVIVNAVGAGDCSRCRARTTAEANHVRRVRHDLAASRHALSSRRQLPCRRRMALAPCRRGPRPGGGSRDAFFTERRLRVLSRGRTSTAGTRASVARPAWWHATDRVARRHRPLPGQLRGSPFPWYGPPHLAEHLGDLDWVSQVAVAHERVVELFARTPSITLVPMKMFTMFSTFDKAVANIQARRSAIDEVIARVAGCEEWGVTGQSAPSHSCRPARRSRALDATAVRHGLPDGSQGSSRSSGVLAPALAGGRRFRRRGLAATGT